ncbi:MAG: serine/threonine-protein kinase [Polyangiales bacterium]
MPTALKSLEAGSVFAREYRIVRLLAEGGMGAVYVVEQLSSGARRALKVLHPDLVRDARTREQFALEARIGASINSGHVVDVIAAGVDEETNVPWMAMELLEGEDLTDLVQRKGRVPVHEVREIFEQMGDALAAAHDAGVIHRDLKPRNVFVARSRLRGMPFVVKVLDFGISKLLEQSVAAVTVTRQIGSPLFMAPEQARTGARLRRSTDVWPMGLLAYYLLTGRHYWRSVEPDGVNLNALLMEIAVEPLVPPSHRGEEQGVAGALPEGFDAWFLQCVHRDPEKRFDDARACTDALRAVLQGRHAPMLETEETVVRTLPSEEALASIAAPAPRVKAPTAAALPTAPTPPRQPSLPPPSFAPAAPLHPSSPSHPTPFTQPELTPLQQAELTVHTANAEVPVPVERPRRPVMALAFAAGGVLTLVCALAFWSLSPRPSEPPPPVTPRHAATPARVHLTFQGLPAGARLTVGGIPFEGDGAALLKGEAPVVVRVEAEGRVPLEFTVLPDRDQNVVVPPMQAVVAPPAVPDASVQLLASNDVDASAAAEPDADVAEPTEETPSSPTSHRPRVGRLSVGAEPPRCMVRIDGRPIGTTPIFSRTLRAGSHRVTCVRGEHTIERVVVVRSGRDADIVFPAH